MTEIIPAIMPKSLADLREKCAQVKKHVSTVQIDVMDGVFVPEITWPYTAGGDAAFAAIQQESESLPYWDSIDVEVDLMVADPEAAAHAWIRAGAARIIIHIESITTPRELLAQLRDTYGYAHELAVGIPEIGIAINTKTENTVLADILPFVDFVQFMGIDRIGYQSEPFAEQVLEKITDFHTQHPEVTISVDGGVSADTASELIHAGATRLVSGSAIFNAADPKTAITELANIT